MQNIRLVSNVFCGLSSIVASLLLATSIQAAEIPVDGTVVSLTEMPAGATPTVFPIGFSTLPAHASSNFIWLSLCNQQVTTGSTIGCHSSNFIFQNGGRYTLSAALQGIPHAQREVPFSSLSRHFTLTMMGRDPAKTYRIVSRQLTGFKSTSMKPAYPGDDKKSNVSLDLVCEHNIFSQEQIDSDFLFLPADGQSATGIELNLNTRINPGMCPANTLKIKFSAANVDDVTLGEFEVFVLEEGSPL